MRRLWKGILLGLFALALLLCVAPATRADDSGQCGDDLYWYFNSGTGQLTILGTGAMYQYSQDNPAPWPVRSNQITGVSLPSGLTTIGSRAFDGCYGLTSVTIPGSVTTIGSEAFYYCTELTSVTLSKGVQRISSSAFHGCEKLAALTIPNSVTSIGNGAFSYCEGLTSVTIPASVTDIANWAFSNCTGLTTVTIGCPAANLSALTFSGCANLKQFKVTAANTAYAAVDGVLFSYDQTMLIAYPKGKKNTSYAIPQGVTTIDACAFSDCDRLTSVTFPSSLKTVGTDAFTHCRGLTAVALPDGVTRISNYAFGYCSGLTSFTVPAGVTYMTGCAVAGCTGLTAIQVAQGNKNYTTVSGVLFSKDKKTLVAYPAGKKSTGYSVPSGVVTIGEGAFQASNALTSVTIPDSVTTIKWRAFAWSDQLTTVTLPSSVLSIGDMAFAGASPSDVYYQGRKAQKARVKIGENNDSLLCAAWHYSEKEKSIAGLTITREPVNASVREGEKASFTVKTSGTAASIQWYYRKNASDSWHRISSATKATYTFTTKAAYTGYQYAADLKNDAGKKLTTDVVTLTVSTLKPVITAQPKAVTVNSGETAAFTVKTTNYETIQWYYRTSPSSKWTKITSGTKATLKVKTKYAYNGFQYACDIKNAYGKVTTTPVTLTVSPQKPVITTQPANQSVTAGAKATFKVVATGADTFQWYYRKNASDAWHKITSATAATYTFTTKSTYNGYQYACDIKNADGKVTTKVVKLTVK